MCMGKAEQPKQRTFSNLWTFIVCGAAVSFCLLMSVFAFVLSSFYGSETDFTAAL